MVENAGFDVVEAVNADEAFRILESRTDIRIVLTDIDMPGSINGLKLAAAVRDRWPPIEIVIVSGHVKPRPEDLPPSSAFFAKPYDEQKLTATLKEFAASH
jgi:CheY-like chemotaxis protein